MWVENLEKGFGDLGKLVVELAVDACAEEGKCLDDALDVRVFALFAIEQEALGDLRVTPCEVAGQFAQVGQFPLVVGQQFFQHSVLFDLAGVR